MAGDSIPLSPSHSVTFSHGELLNADYRQVYETVEVSVDEGVRLVFSVPVDRVEVRGGQVDEEFGAPPYVVEAVTILPILR